MAFPPPDQRIVHVVTTSRADFGIYQPVIAALRESAILRPALFVSGNNVPATSAGDAEARAAELGRAASLPIAAIVPMPLGDGGAVSIGEAMGAVTAASARALHANRPDILLVLGDRYEMHAVAVSASALRIPVAHIHGGEESEGAIDNLYRHSITKLSHLHFCATDLSRHRILAMGEEPWRVHVAGAPALDGLAALAFDERAALLARLGRADTPFFMATYHPETLDVEGTLPALEALIAALDEVGVPTLFSRANADEAGQAINDRLDAHQRTKSWLHVHDSLGRQGYFSAMRAAELMIGNSSSGIIEAASFGLPVINVGQRQAGRERSLNTIDAEPNKPALLAAIAKARSTSFREEARKAPNVYGRGNAAETIRRVLEQVPLDRALIVKRFNLV